jgi:cytochrome P450
MTDNGATPAEKGAAGAAIVELVAAHVRARAARPAADLTSRVVTQFVATGELGEAEAVHNLALVLGAGHDTSANMISLAALSLLLDPPAAAPFVADPEGRDNAVEELLRYHSIIQLGLARVATADIAVGDTVIAAGDGVVLSLASANTDPRRFADPGTLDPGRADARHHVAFGFGPHACLGHFLARSTIRAALAALFARRPGLRLAVPVAELPFKESMDFHGLSHLPVVNHEKETT